MTTYDLALLMAFAGMVTASIVYLAGSRTPRALRVRHLELECRKLELENEILKLDLDAKQWASSAFKQPIVGTDGSAFRHDRGHKTDRGDT